MMKTVFVESRYGRKVSLPKSLVSELPESVALFTPVQFVGSVSAMKKQLEKAGRRVQLLKPHHSTYSGQLLGCGIQEFRADFDAFLYIGDGTFHPYALLLKNSKDVFVFNPFSRSYTRLNESSKEVKKMRQRQMAGLVKFHASKSIGVIVSTKPGQSRLEDALRLRKKHKEKDFYFMLFDNVDFSQLENFNFIDAFVNTACPRIAYDDFEKFPKAVVNVDDII